MIRRDRYSVLRPYARGLWLLLALVFVRSASAQGPEVPGQSVQPPPDSPATRETLRTDTSELFGGWAPIGPAPVDQAGAGRRGYVMHGEDSDVTAVGSNRFSIHTVAANDFYREQNGDFLVTLRYEAHSLALDYRRGFKLRSLPRFEFGGQIQLHESDSGVLNGLIVGFEGFWASMTGHENSKNELRLKGGTLPPLGTSISRNNLLLYRHDGSGSGLGDVYVVGKMALLDVAPSASPRAFQRELD